MENNKRNESMDSLKFFLIWLVVLGHLVTINNGKIESAIHTYIFLFHMPLFCLLSGYFTNIEHREKIISGTNKLMETFLVWHIIGFSLIGVGIWKEKVTLINILTPFWHYWYLFSLIIWRLIAFKIGIYIKQFYITVIAFIIALIVGIIPVIEYPLSLSRTFVFGPFFILGLYLRNTNIINKYINNRILIYISIIIIGLFSIIVLIKSNWGRVLYNAEPYVSIYDSIWLGLSLRFIYIISALLLSFSFLCIWSRIKIFSKYGKYTLHILIIHSWFVLLFKLYIGQNLILSFLFSLIIIVISLWIAQYKYSYILLNPVSSIIKKIKK